MKTLPPAIAAKLETGRLEVRYMLRMDLDIGSTGIWSGEFALTFEGVDYAPLAGAMALGEIPGSAGLSVDQCEITVSGLSAAINSVMAVTDWHQRPATVFRAYLGDGGAVEHVEAVFSGFMDQAPVSSADGGEYSVTLTLESNSRELDRANGRTRSDADQRGVDSDDAFYCYVNAVTANPQIYWGRSGPSSPF